MNGIIVGERMYALSEQVTGHKIALMTDQWQEYALSNVCPCDLGVFTLLEDGTQTCSVCMQSHERAKRFAWEIVAGDLRLWAHAGFPTMSVENLLTTRALVSAARS